MAPRAESGDALAAARTFLFVPANDRRKREKAWTAGADAVILDLEDAVAAGAKAAARGELAAVLATGSGAAGGPIVVVRVNALDTREGPLDLQALAELTIDAVLVPKADPATLSLAVEATGLPVIALVETARAVLGAGDVAHVPGIRRLMFGPVDLAGELGCEPGQDGAELLVARSHLVLASAAAGLAPPIDGPSVAIGDRLALDAETHRARRLGFTAKACIHPAQIEPVARVLRPSPERVAWARRVIDAYETALAGDTGVIAVDGEMVDVPVARRAYAVLRQSGAS